MKSDSADLIELQKIQNEHDKHHHPDIYNTSYPDRMNHYVLHFSKYVGRLSEESNSEGEIYEILEKTIADSFIVALAAANTLNLELQEELTNYSDEKVRGVAAWADKMGSTQELDDPIETKNWLFQEMAKPAGEMSNAMESLDHMESIDVRTILEEGTVEIVAHILTAAGCTDIDLEELTNDRWEEIEQNSIL
jgi:hypothetical protein